MKKWIAAAAAGVAVLVCAGCSDEEPDPMSVASDECHARVKDRMKDPDSTQFEDPKIQLHGRNKYSVEGTMRSRNSYGGMVVGGYDCVITVNGTDASADSVVLTD